MTPRKTDSTGEDTMGESVISDNNTGDTATEPGVAEAVIADGKETIEECASLYLVVRKLLLTSLGALAMTAEEAREFLDKLIDRGEVAEGEVQHLLEQVQARQNHLVSPEPNQNHTPQSIRHRAETVVEERFETLLGRLNVPTRGDIEELSQKISELDKKVAALKKKRQESQNSSE